jgi:hypothetical protein
MFALFAHRATSYLRTIVCEDAVFPLGKEEVSLTSFNVYGWSLSKREKPPMKMEYGGGSECVSYVSRIRVEPGAKRCTVIKGGIGNPVAVSLVLELGCHTPRRRFKVLAKSWS